MSHPFDYLMRSVKLNAGMANSVNPEQEQAMKLFSYTTQLSTKFILLINVKMPTIVGILTFISKINTTSARLKAGNVFMCRYAVEISCSVEHEKSFITAGQGLGLRCLGLHSVQIFRVNTVLNIEQS